MSFIQLLMAPLLMDQEPKEVYKLLKRLMSPRTRIRRVAMQSLTPLFEETGLKYLPHLLHALMDRDVNVSTKASHLLQQLGPQANLADTVLAQALSDPNPDVVAMTAHAIVLIGATDDSLVPFLVRALTEYAHGQRNEYTRSRLIRALSMLGHHARAAAPAFLELLQHPTDTTRWAAVVALKRVGHPRALPFLHQRFYHEPEEYVRASIIEAIASLGEKDPAWVATFIDALEDPEWEVRYQATIALAQWGPVAAAASELLCERIPIEDDSQVRINILHAIGKIGDESAIPTLLEELDGIDVDFLFAAEAIMALGRLGGPSVTPTLLEAMEDPEPSLCARAALALGHAGEASSEILEALHTHHKGPNPGVRRYATQALARLGQHSQTIEYTMADALAYWAARHTTTITNTLPAAEDDLDQAMLLYPTSEEAEDTIEELQWNIQWFQRQIHLIWQRQRDQHTNESTLFQHTQSAITTALAYLQTLPHEPPGTHIETRRQDITRALHTLQQQLHDDPIPAWQAHLEQALFE